MLRQSIFFPVHSEAKKTTLQHLSDCNDCRCLYLVLVSSHDAGLSCLCTKPWGQKRRISPYLELEAQVRPPPCPNGASVRGSHACHRCCQMPSWRLWINLQRRHRLYIQLWLRRSSIWMTLPRCQKLTSSLDKLHAMRSSASCAPISLFVTTNGNGSAAFFNEASF